MAKKIIDKEEAKNKLKTGASDFKKFISRGDVVDMAVGIIIGAAFGKIVTSLVDDILMPVIGMIIGGVDFTDLSIKVGSATLKYGMFIQSIVDFLIVAFCIFLVVKIFEKFKKQEAEKEPELADDVKLLTEIRDLLKNKK